MNQPRTGRVWSPVVTPFTDDLAPDSRRFTTHCRWLLDNDVGLAIFGTNSEANSMTVGEKRALIDTLAEAGIAGEQLMPGTGSCAIGDAVELTRHAVDNGCAGVLMLPPFYYKGVSDEGLYRYFAEVIERVASPSLKVYLYHIPPVSQVPLTLDLIERLHTAYPDTIAGIKDSSGEWSNTQALIDAFGGEIDVYAGSEHFLLDTLRAGGAGCISATANVNPGPIAELARAWREADADTRQTALSALRGEFERFPMIPALKAATALYGDDAAWRRVRPPLVELDDAQCQSLKQALDARGFTMPGRAG
ncbi:MULTISPECIES: dihydrodipicolinate synthase family protein [Halomonadaceae]|uniref:dihydrodipicolinate synthase family protein n=1 Tax=Halomonadaceae TaxID=28256 RepID=UPI0015986352|nr:MULTISPECIES: dihydrodipicolinate synthase family protein [Halomonas]QJQ95940.1 dihydrodipicolinate synthase family protein [Halomonas sp. PA5]